MSTFIESLKLFSKSVDILNDTNHTALLSIVKSYFKKRFKAEFWELLVPSYDRSFNSPNEATQRLEYLTPLFASYDKTKHGIAPVLENNQLTGQTAHAYIHNCPLWITSEAKALLKTNKQLIDSWSAQSELLAKYKDFSENKCDSKTSIILPINVNNSTYILNIETAEFLIITDKIKAELEDLSETLSNIFAKHNATQKTLGSTVQSLEALSNLVGEITSYNKPSIFFAYGSNADIEVLECIRECLEKHSNKLLVYDWLKDHQPGSISKKTLKEMKNAQYGVCYLSEPNNTENKVQYSDNPNALIEAGYMYAQTEFESTMKGWLPLREVSSSQVPFDIQDERILTIPRCKKGKLNKPDFNKVLEQRIDCLLVSSSSSKQ